MERGTGMQSTFLRGVNALGVQGNLLIRQPTVVPPPPAPPPAPMPAGALPAVAPAAGGAAGAAGAGGAAAAGAGVPGPPGPPGPPVVAPAPPPAPTVVYPAVQRFHLDGNEYFVKSDGAVNVAPCPINNGYWIVPYIILPLPLPTGEPVGRPANATEPLPESLKDAAVAAGTTTRYHLLRPVPDRDYAKLGEHFLESQDNYFTIKYDFIKKALDAAERMDYEFAVRMQGLQNCNINAVWTCTDLGFDAYDRSLMMEQFLRGYVGRFLSQVSQRPGRELDPDHVVREAIQMHEKFCEAWVQEHKRGLSPLVESCAEALVGNFCEGPLKAAELAGLTRKQISRLLRRDPVFSPQFGLCLHFFMVKLDQDRSGRNANYKSMFNSFNSNVLAMKTFENFMRSNAGHLGNYLENRLRTLATRRFDPLCIDWYGIVSQLHTPSVRYTGVNKRRRAAAAAAAGGMDGGLGPGGLW